MKIPIGEVAAVATACCWTMSSLAFAAAGKRIGSLALNLIRLVIAFAFLTLFCWVDRGVPLPSDAPRGAWLWLSVSSAAGVVLGDLCLFRAFILIGPRVSMLVMALVPPIAAVLSWLLLGEALKPFAWGAMALTIAGIVWVVLERAPSGEASEPKARPARGLLLAAGGALGQASGLVLSKLGMKDYSPFAASQVRILVGIAGFGLIISAARWWPHVSAGLKNRSGMAFATLGAFAGPFLGISLSLVAIQNTDTGVAATIMAMVPVLIIPFVIVIHKERVSPRAIAGALVAVAGVALLWVR